MLRSLQAASSPVSEPRRVRERLQHVKAGLQSILEMLSKDGQRELQLVPPAQSAKKKGSAKSASRKR